MRPLDTPSTSVLHSSPLTTDQLPQLRNRRCHNKQTTKGHDPRRFAPHGKSTCHRPFATPLGSLSPVLARPAPRRVTEAQSRPRPAPRTHRACAEFRSRFRITLPTAFRHRQAVAGQEVLRGLSFVAAAQASPGPAAPSVNNRIHQPTTMPTKAEPATRDTGSRPGGVPVFVAAAQASPNMALETISTVTGNRHAFSATTARLQVADR